MGDRQEHLLAARLDALATAIAARAEAEDRLRLALAEIARLERALEHGEVVSRQEWDAAVHAVQATRAALMRLGDDGILPGLPEPVQNPDGGPAMPSPGTAPGASP